MQLKLLIELLWVPTLVVAPRPRAPPFIATPEGHKTAARFAAVEESCPSGKLADRPPHSAAVETVPIFLKFHKVGSTTLTTVLQTVCDIHWWNATPRALVRPAAAFCCGDPFWHQTIHQYRAAGACSLRRCVRGFGSGLRAVKIFALFREPKSKFVSGLYYFARWEARKVSLPPSATIT